MHEVGLLGVILPEYGHAHCKVSYDFYHRYTADEHALRMVRFLEELEKSINKFENLLEDLNDNLLSKQEKIDYLKLQISKNIEKIDKIIEDYNANN